MYQVILFIHVFISLALIGLVLIQHGKGADIGAAFGSGASQTVFGSQGTGSFLMKFTGGLAFAFFGTCLLLGALAARDYKKSLVINSTSTVSQPQTLAQLDKPLSNLDKSDLANTSNK